MPKNGHLQEGENGQEMYVEGQWILVSDIQAFLNGDEVALDEAVKTTVTAMKAQADALEE